MTLLAVDQSWFLGLSLPDWTRLAAVVTGSLVGAEFAAKRGFDPIGVFGLAFAQGLGGLVLLELLLLNGTPLFLEEPKYLIGTAVASVAGFFFAGLLSRSYRLLLTLDALSTGFLVSIGVESAIALQLPLISAVFLGTLTATAGLVLRDVLAGVSPTLLRPGVLNAAVALMNEGAKSVSAYVTHGVLSGGAVGRVTASPIRELVITDSIQATEAVRLADNIRQLSIAPLMAEAIHRISHETSVSSLFES